MLLIFLSVALMVLFGCLSVKFWGNLSECCAFLSVVSGIFLFVFLLIILVNQINGTMDIAKYEVDVTRVQAAIDNPQLTVDERKQAIEIATSINKRIGVTKVRRNNLWFNWFHYAPYGDLKTVDIGSIKPVNQNFTGNVSVDLTK